METGVLEWFRIGLGSLDEIRKGFVDACDKLRDRGLLALRDYRGRFGGVCDFVVLRLVCENKVMGEDVLGGLPESLRWQDQVSKKVYFNNCVEWSSPVLASNFVSNRSLENFAPELVGELRRLSFLVSPVGFLKSKIKRVDDVFEYGEVIRGLSEGDRFELSNYLFSLGG